MHPNPAFRDADRNDSLNFARERGFGVLAVNAEDAPLISHIPFLVSADGTFAELHLVRSNPIVRALAQPVKAKIAVSGPDSYISPDWYGLEDQVPTWNYIAVHLTGTLELRPQEDLHDLLDRQSAVYEERLLPKAPWKTDKMTPEVMERMMRMIVPCRLRIDRVDSTTKLNQNKPDAARESAAKHVQAYGFGTSPDVLAAMMLGAKAGPS